MPDTKNDVKLLSERMHFEALNIKLVNSSEENKPDNDIPNTPT